jgi:hypothetical protein
MLAVIAALAPLPVLAQTYDCTLTRDCLPADGLCRDADGRLALVIGADGQSAQIEVGGGAVALTVVDSTPGARTFLAYRTGDSAGILTLAADGTLAASSHTIDGQSLIGVSSAGTCTPRND